MPIPMNGLLVLIASPTDTAEERAAVRNSLVDWNIQRGRREKVAVLPWLWERSAVPIMGGRPQAFINRQAVDQSDVVVAFFDARLGSVGDPKAEDVAARRLYAPDDDLDRNDLAALFEGEWMAQHVAPAAGMQILRDTARDFHDAERTLDAAVATARQLGLSWSDIGTATGMNKQAAHSRWSRLDHQQID